MFKYNNEGVLNMKQGETPDIRIKENYINKNVYDYINEQKYLAKIVVDIFFRTDLNSSQKKGLLNHLIENCKYHSILLFSQHKGYSILYYALLTANYDLITFLIDQARTLRKIKLANEEKNVSQFTVLNGETSITAFVNAKSIEQDPAFNETSITAFVNAKSIEQDPAFKLLLLLTQSPNREEASLYNSILESIQFAISYSVYSKVSIKEINNVPSIISWFVPNKAAEFIGAKYNEVNIVHDLSYEKVFTTVLNLSSKILLQYNKLAEKIIKTAPNHTTPDNPYIPATPLTLITVIKSLKGKKDHPCYQLLLQAGVIAKIFYDVYSSHEDIPPNIVSIHERSNGLKEPRTFISRLVKPQLYADPKFNVYTKSK